MALFRDGLHEDDIKHWNELFRSSSELAGAKPGFYLEEWENFRPISDYFAEGSLDGHAIAHMAAALDVVCHQVVSGTADAKTVYYELGQLLTSMHHWLQSTTSSVHGKSLLEASFPSIESFFRRYKPERGPWPSRVYAFIE